jgi:hypothetical protein
MLERIWNSVRILRFPKMLRVQYSDSPCMVVDREVHDGQNIETFSQSYTWNAWKPKSCRFIISSCHQMMYHHLHIVQIALGSTQPPIQWERGALSPGVKRQGRETDHSPPTSTEVKKAWTYICTPPFALLNNYTQGQLYFLYLKLSANRVRTIISASPLQNAVSHTLAIGERHSSSCIRSAVVTHGILQRWRAYDCTHCSNMDIFSHHWTFSYFNPMSKHRTAFLNI